MENVSIAGAGRIIGGIDYGKISISGSGTVTSSVRCAGFSCSGSGHAKGDIECTGKISTAGSFRCDGNVRAAELKAAGAAKYDGDVQADKLSAAGAVSIGGNLRGEELRSDGSLTVAGDVEAECADLRGTVKITGLLNAERIEIHPSHADSEIGSIGGSSIRVYRHTLGENHSLLGTVAKLFCGAAGASGRLITDVIEGDEVDLDSTEAKIVRGRSVTIRACAKIGRVEYSESYTAEEGAEIGEAVKSE